MNIQQVNDYLELWDDNKLEKLWKKLNNLSNEELAYISAWMTVMIRDTGEVRLSQWIVWLEAKSNAESR